MFTDLTHAFTELFTERRSRLAVLVLVFAMAAIPVSELAVIRTFSELVIGGPKLYKTDPSAVIAKGAVFFIGFGITRALHHAVRFWRVRVLRKGFESSGLQRTPVEAAWEWAQGFELSIVSVGVVQVVTLSALFVFMDVIVAVTNAVVCTAALMLYSTLYRRQLGRQQQFAAEGSKPRSTAVSTRISSRVFAAEYGSAIATAGMGAMMAVVLWRSLKGELSSADAVVLFLGVRLLYGHLSAVAPSAMRFARDSARRAVEQNRARARATAAETVIDETVPELVSAGGRAAPGRTATARRRAQLLTHMVMAGQRGERTTVGDLAAKLAGAGALTVKESNAIRVSHNFAAYASGSEASKSLRVMWWPRPFPGNYGDWLGPFLLQRLTGRRVQFQPPTAQRSDSHLVTVGSIGRFVRPQSIVLGTGISDADTGMEPAATYVSVRGPVTAHAIAASGGPRVSDFGDPGLLLRRALPISRTATNGRLALVRHHAHAELPVTLPDVIDEHSVLVSAPNDIATFVTGLSEYEGVVTSAMHVMITCHSYGIPCTLVTFDGYETAVHGSGIKYRDYSLGAGLDRVWQPQAADLDLTRVDWMSRLQVETVSDQKLDEIEAALGRALSTFDLSEFGDEPDDEMDDADA